MSTSRSHKKRRTEDSPTEDDSIARQHHRFYSAGSMIREMSQVPMEKPRDFTKMFDQLRAITTCKVCFRILYEPYSLSCGHIYCYSCLCQWFQNKPNSRKKTCPDCRADVKVAPAPVFLVREITQELLQHPEMLQDGETREQHKKWQAEEAEIVERDRLGTEVGTGGLFSGVFKEDFWLRLRPVRDEEDNILRCPDCLWELEEEYGHSCPRCGVELESDRASNSNSEYDSEVEPDGDDESNGGYSSEGEADDLDGDLANMLDPDHLDLNHDMHFELDGGDHIHDMRVVGAHYDNHSDWESASDAEQGPYRSEDHIVDENEMDEFGIATAARTNDHIHDRRRNHVPSRHRNQVRLSESEDEEEDEDEEEEDYDSSMSGFIASDQSEIGGGRSEEDGSDFAGSNLTPRQLSPAGHRRCSANGNSFDRSTTMGKSDEETDEESGEGRPIRGLGHRISSSSNTLRRASSSTVSSSESSTDGIDAEADVIDHVSITSDPASISSDEISSDSGDDVEDDDEDEDEDEDEEPVRGHAPTRRALPGIFAPGRGNSRGVGRQFRALTRQPRAPTQRPARPAPSNGPSDHFGYASSAGLRHSGSQYTNQARP